LLLVFLCFCYPFKTAVNEKFHHAVKLFKALFSLALSLRHPAVGCSSAYECDEWSDYILYAWLCYASLLLRSDLFYIVVLLFFKEGRFVQYFIGNFVPGMNERKRDEYFI